MKCFSRPYGNFSGRDASRGLAKQSFDENILTPVDSKIDTLDDLTDEDKDNLKGWEDLFKAKYIACG
jgi:membrane-associated progesterone receptor component